MGFLSGLASGLVGGFFGYKGQKKTNQANKEIASDQMQFQTVANAKQMAFEQKTIDQAERYNERMFDKKAAFDSAQVTKQNAFQERMSNTANQRAADDLQKAGLNRILALGSPSSSPTGSAAVGGQVSGNKGSGSTSGGASARMENEATAALQSATTALNMRNLKSQNKLLEQQSKKLKEETRVTKNQADVTGAYKHPKIKSADIIDGGIDAITNSGKSLGRNAAKFKLWLQDQFTDDPNSGWYDNLKKEVRSRKKKPRTIYIRKKGK